MCGRATLITSVDEIAAIFEVPKAEIGPPRFNIAPSQPIATIRIPRGDGGRELALLRWGLVPWWTKEEEAKRMASRCIQARAETLSTTPAYRDAFRERRCLVVVDGFFEWKEKVPHRVTTRDNRPFAIAGVWETWKARDGEIVETAAVVTTAATGAVASIHARMPLVLGAKDHNTWLSGSTLDAARLLTAVRAEELVFAPVSTWVNDVRHDDPRCIEPRGDAPLGQISLRF